MRIDVRALPPDEWATLRAVRLAALADSPEAYGSTYAEELAQDEAGWRRFAETFSWFVAVDAGAPETGAGTVGIVAGAVASDASGRPDGAGRVVIGLWVAPDARGQGVASALMAALSSWAVAGGATWLRLGVADGNEPAARLYRRLGFVPTGARRPLRRQPGRSVEEYRLAL